MQIKVKRLVPSAKLPMLASTGAACFDVHTSCGTPQWVTKDKPLVCSTGLAFEVPTGHVMLVFSRSGHGFKHDVRLSNAVGVIDSDFRGELKVKLAADNDNYLVHPGERIAQVMLLPLPTVIFDEVDHLSSTDRGTGGFGSSGK